MFEIALKAKLPVIAVTTDDLVNLPMVLKHLVQSIAKIDVCRFEKQHAVKPGPYLYWTTEVELITDKLYADFMASDHQIILVNPSRPCPYAFDAGVLPTPMEMVKGFLKSHAEAAEVPALLQALKGLSLKTIVEIVMLTQARTGVLTAPEARKTRSSVSGTFQGLYPVDTSYDFYSWPPRLKEWLTLNSKYFKGNVHQKLIPRGILLEGAPGVGKSTAAKVIAHELEVPLYRLDIATTLDRFVGVSENRVSKILQLVDREEPCVLLIDEVEKIFEDGGDAGVTQRILSQLLWWLAEHQSRVFVVMTTNNKALIPQELYRAGRVDLAITIPKLPFKEAKLFVQRVMSSITTKPTDMAQIAALTEALKNTSKDEFSHSELAELVYTEIKRRSWL